jgi:hypothetical protein
MSLADAETVDQYLTEVINSPSMLNMGRPTSEGLRFIKMQDSLRDVIDNIKPQDTIGGVQGFDALLNARKTWAQSARLRDIEAIIQKAQGMEQPATGIRTGMRTLLNNPNRIRGFSPSEVRAIKEASQTGLIGNGFRAFGSGLLPLVTAGVGGTSGFSAAGPVGSAAGTLLAGAAGYGIQQASKAAGVANQMRRAERVIDTIATGQKRDPQMLARILGTAIGTSQ